MYHVALLLAAAVRCACNVRDVDYCGFLPNTFFFFFFRLFFLFSSFSEILLGDLDKKSVRPIHILICTPVSVYLYQHRFELPNTMFSFARGNSGSSWPKKIRS